MSHSTPGALHRGGVRTIAVFEGAKGLLVLAASFGALTLLHRDLREMAEHIVHILGLNPSSRWPGIFLDAAQKATDANLLVLAAGAMVYSVVRLAEAYGLWRARAWAEWLGALSGGIYLPFEIYEIVQRVTPLRIGLFILNLVVVAYLSRLLWQRRRGPDRG